MDFRAVRRKRAVAVQSLTVEAQALGDALGVEPFGSYDRITDPDHREMLFLQDLSRFIAEVRQAVEGASPPLQITPPEGTTDALAPQILNDLAEGGVADPADTATMSDDAVLAIKGIGPKALAHIREAYPAQASEDASTDGTGETTAETGTVDGADDDTDADRSVHDDAAGENG